MKINGLSTIIKVTSRKEEKEKIKYKLIWSDSDCEEDPSDYEELGPDPETDYPDMPEWVYDRFTKIE